MNAVATLPTKSVTIDMANRYGMEPAAFEATLRNTIMPVSRGQVMQATREEFAAFLLVAREYRLNPITRQIYAFPKKGGGIIPVVSVDGWAFLINEHPAFDGMEFEDHHDGDGSLLSVTCRIYRKDRRMPVVVTEYLSECKRDTDAWAMKHRMLRHKTLIQCARYAFAFSGIFDEDEAERFAAIPAAGAAMSRQTPPPAPRREPPQQIEHQPPVGHAEVAGAPESVIREELAAIDAAGEHDADGVVSMDSLLSDLDERLGFARTADDVEEGYTAFDAEALLSDYDGGVQQARALKAKHLDRVGPAEHEKPQQDQPAVDDFPAVDQIKANEATGTSKDPFAIPPTFRGGGHYQIFIGVAADAANLGDGPRLASCWNDTKNVRDELRQSGQLVDTDIMGLRDRVMKALDRVNPPADQPFDGGPPPAPRRAAQKPHAQQGQEAAAQAPAEPAKPDSDDPIASYTSDMEAAFATARTKEDVDRFWFGSTDRRDEETGADEPQRAKWRLARNKAKNALPNAEG